MRAVLPLYRSGPMEFRGHGTKLPWPGGADRLGAFAMASRRSARTVRVFCSECGFYLYKYRKGGGGRLVSCFVDKIVQGNTEGSLNCPRSGHASARRTMAYGRLANKIIQGKVTVRR